MPNNDNAQEFDKLKKKYLSFRRNIPQKAAITMVNFFKRNFQVGGFVDVPFQRWKPSTYPGARRTMVKSGNTRREIRKIRISQSQVVVGIANQNHYAKIHNEGGKILITPKMRRFFWAKFKETGKGYWKGLALTKKTHIEIPQRKFIGDSKALEKTLDRMLIRELQKALS
ncbi:phage virion morphogenesis protein [Elizabethkingia anophelis]|jgi:phage gpG-like protein|uniref:phage virion morphogenesis protein n=1 Tax=Elizabethkingia anophelis TaxID=1117645 RepID=UPI001626A7AC|nr:phage virion morphogenesis protein [Elizabethkingia anophelis]